MPQCGMKSSGQTSPAGGVDTARQNRMRQTMSGILERLDPKQFRRIHRSAIVNLDFVRELQSWTGGDMLVLMRDGTKLTLSRTYREQFAEGQ